MVEVDWFNVNVVNSGYNVEIVERKNRTGRYAFRNQIEPLIISLQKDLKNNKKVVKTLIDEVSEIRKSVPNENDNIIKRCDNVLRKLKSIN